MSFAPTIERLHAEGRHRLARRVETESRISSALVDLALASGLTVSVYDGEEWTVKRSTDVEEIIGALFTTDEDVLVLRRPDGTKFGTFYLVYGNDGADVIADYSARTDEELTSLTEWLKPVEELAESLA